MICSLFLCIRFPKAIAEAVSEAFYRCTDIMLPSMFIFMCLSCISSSSGMTAFILRPFKIIYRGVFHLDAKGFSIFILSLFSGYPAGIKLIYDALDRNEITKKTADRLSCFCFSSGPAFISGVAGVLFPDSRVSLLLFISVVIGNVTTAFLTGLKDRCVSSENADAKVEMSCSCVVNSVAGASSAILKMCAMIIFFSGISEMLRLSGVTDIISAAAAKITGESQAVSCAYTEALLEISKIVSLPSGLSAVPVAAALLSFGGICVFLQLISISEGRLPAGRFLLSRIVSAVFSGVSCRILMSVFDFGLCEDAFSYSITAESSLSPIPSVFLVIMSLMLITAINGKTARRRG